MNLFRFQQLENYQRRSVAERHVPLSAVPLGRNCTNGVYMKIICTICFLISMVYHNGYSQGYFPLQIGNQWDFGYINYPPTPTTGYRYSFSIKVVGDTIMSNSKTYAIVLDPYHNSGNHISYKRQEGSILYDYAPSGDVVEHDFTYKNGDTTARYTNGNDTILTIVTVGVAKQFGRNLKFWAFYTDAINNPGFDLWSKRSITDSLGYTFFAGMDEDYYCMGIKIDGQIYGTITNVLGEPISSPTQFQLFQNYPNPFNPTTEIDFVIPKATFATLKIYDILGREVSTLLSKELAAGHHSQEWNATNYSSGVYFYTLRSGKYVESKKLLLQK
jgi:hypothetical protein